MTEKIPQATARRLPLYYRFILNLHNQGKARVSSKELSEAVKVDSATIRRDFSYFGALGLRSKPALMPLAFGRWLIAMCSLTEVFHRMVF